VALLGRASEAARGSGVTTLPPPAAIAERRKQEAADDALFLAAFDVVTAANAIRWTSHVIASPGQHERNQVAFGAACAALRTLAASQAAK